MLFKQQEHSRSKYLEHNDISSPIALPQGLQTGPFNSRWHKNRMAHVVRDCQYSIGAGVFDLDALVNLMNHRLFNPDLSTCQYARTRPARKERLCPASHLAASSINCQMYIASKHTRSNSAASAP